MGTKVKELTQASLAAKKCTCLTCVPRKDRIAHDVVWRRSLEEKKCPLKEGVNA